MDTSRCFTCLVAAAVPLLLAVPAFSGEIRIEVENVPRVEAADKKLGMALMSASVSAGGSLVRSAGAVSVEHPENGKYYVYFNRNIADCHHVSSIAAPTATLYSPIIIASGAPSGTNLNRVLVRTADPRDDTETDAPFTVMVFCAE